MDMATKIKNIRKEKNFSQRQFAEAIGYSQSAVAQWENGQKTPTFQAMVSIFEFAKSKRVKIKRNEFFSV